MTIEIAFWEVVFAVAFQFFVWDECLF